MSPHFRNIRYAILMCDHQLILGIHAHSSRFIFIHTMDVLWETTFTHCSDSISLLSSLKVIPLQILMYPTWKSGALSSHFLETTDLWRAFSSLHSLSLFTCKCRINREVVYVVALFCFPLWSFCYCFMHRFLSGTSVLIHQAAKLSTPNLSLSTRNVGMEEGAETEGVTSQ